MNWKKIGKALLFPHMAIMIALVPIATVFLVYSMVFVGTKTVVAYISYVVAAYTLTVWCVRIPQLIKLIKSFKEENKYARRWQDDTRLRVGITLYASLVWNVAYAALQLGLGFYHGSFWYFSLAMYYVSLAVMRFFLARYTTKNPPGERMDAELKRYRACGWVLLVMNLALSAMIFFMVYWNRTFNHHEITTIAMAAYTFTSLTMAIINIVKFRKIGSPVYSATKAVSLAAACVSMLTLESTMLTTFSDGSMTLSGRRMMLGMSGGAISAFIIVIAVFMIVIGTKKLKLIRSKERE